MHQPGAALLPGPSPGCWEAGLVVGHLLGLCEAILRVTLRQLWPDLRWGAGDKPGFFRPS